VSYPTFFRITTNKVDLYLAKPAEIVTQVCTRLRTERLARQMTQAELAARAGIGVNTVSNLEAGRNVGFETLVRVAMVLGRADELQNLFLPKVDTLQDVLRYEETGRRQRIRKGSHNA